MNESLGTLETANKMRTAYIESRNGNDFVEYVQRVFGMDLFTAELIWETIDTVVDLGCTSTEAGA